ncbi:MAG: hypothetical protein KY476_18215 [Planctomycetes bacterium]|nr:hypothetical protein [Planctomycetota bacterium]
MVARRQVSHVILCEDVQHQVLFRWYLRLSGFNVGPRKLRIERAPKGFGSAEQFVRERYPTEVQTYRARNPAYWALVVAIDADKWSIADRVRQLSEALQDAGEEARTANERIALLIPRRNVETWIHYLLGHGAVDEISDYRKFYRDRPKNEHCRPAAERLMDLKKSETELPEDCPESLRAGLEELKRLD